MSLNFFLVADSTRTYLHVGQGWTPTEFRLYNTGNLANQVAAFLAYHLGSDIRFVSEHNLPDEDYIEVVPQVDGDGIISFIKDPEDLGHDRTHFILKPPPKEQWKDWT